MTTDTRITEDLAVVGRTSRLRPIELEATLRAAGAILRPRTSEGSVAVIYVARCARAWGGVAGVITIAGLCAHLVFPNEPTGSLFQSLIYLPRFWIVAIVFGIVFGAHVLGGWLATLQVLRGALDDTALRLAAMRARTRAVTASIAGITSFVLFFGMMEVILGDEVLANLIPRRYVYKPELRPAIVMLVPAILASVVGAIVAGQRTSIRGLTFGVVLLVATIGLGFTFDGGTPDELFIYQRTVSLPFRAVLTVTGTIGLFLTVAGIVFRIHRREDAVLAPPSS